MTIKELFLTFHDNFRSERWDLLLWPASIGACWLLDRYHRRERDCIIKWKDLQHSNELAKVHEEIEEMKNEQTAKNIQLKEYRSKINTLELENEALKRVMDSDGKPKKGFQIDSS